MSKDNKKWECVRARLFKSGINSLRAHFLLAVLIFFGKNIFSYSLIFLIQFYMNRRSQICQNSITLHLLMIIRLGLKKIKDFGETAFTSKSIHWAKLKKVNIGSVALKCKKKLHFEV